MKRQNLHYLQVIAFSAISALVLTGCASMSGHLADCQCSKMGYCPFSHSAHAPANSVAVATQDTTGADKSLMKELLSKDYTEIKNYLPEEPKRMVWVDDTIKEAETDLIPFFSEKNSRLLPKGVSMDNTENAVYLYFTENADGTPQPLRFRIQYYADDPLKYYEAVFNIDGFEYRFKPANFNRGQVKKMYWENSDDELTCDDKDLVYALAHGQWVQLKLLGADAINHVKTLTDDQIQDFYRTLQLYRLKGGTFMEKIISENHIK